MATKGKMTEVVNEFESQSLDNKVNDYNIMENFCLEIKDPIVSRNFLHAINNKGAFRRFRNLLNEKMELTEHWYSYRDETYK